MLVRAILLPASLSIIGREKWIDSLPHVFPLRGIFKHDTLHQMARHPTNLIFSLNRNIDDTLKQLSVEFREVIPHCLRERRFQVLQFLPEGLVVYQSSLSLTSLAASFGSSEPGRLFGSAKSSFSGSSKFPTESMKSGFRVRKRADSSWIFS